jgi:hypothetical protein
MYCATGGSCVCYDNADSRLFMDCYYYNYCYYCVQAGKAPGSQPSDPDFTQMEQALKVADALVRPNIRAATAAAASTTVGTAAAGTAAADDMDTSSSSAKAEPVLQRSDAPRTDVATDVAEEQQEQEGARFWRNDMARLIVSAMLGFVQLRTGQLGLAAQTMAAVEKVTAASPAVLVLPMPWHAVHLVAQMLWGLRLPEAYEGLACILREARVSALHLLL